MDEKVNKLIEAVTEGSRLIEESVNGREGWVIALGNTPVMDKGTGFGWAGGSVAVFPSKGQAKRIAEQLKGINPTVFPDLNVMPVEVWLENHKAELPELIGWFKSNL